MAAVGTVTWESAGLSHTGQRAHNEDFFLSDVGRGIYVVADGVGGRDAGEIASRISCEVIVDQISTGLAQSFAAAERAIAEAVARGEGRTGMAATAVALHVQGSHFDIAWLGDCRAYLWDGKLRLLTRDHSLVEAMLARGEINLQQAAQHPQRNVILAALGGGTGGAEVGTNTGEVGGRGLFVLCSDGLCDTLDNAQMSEILAEQRPVPELTQRLLDAAVTQGCRDNVTVLVIGFDCANDHTGNVRYAHSVRTYDPQQGLTLDETRPLVRSSTKVRSLGVSGGTTTPAGDATALVQGRPTGAQQETASIPRPRARWRLLGGLVLALLLVAAGLLSYVVMR